MRLHESWISDPVVGCRGADTAIAFLEDDGEDEARIDAGGRGNGLNGGGDIGDFAVGGVGYGPLGAGLLDGGFIVVEHSFKTRYPCALRGPSLGYGPCTAVDVVDVCTALLEHIVRVRLWCWNWSSRNECGKAAGSENQRNDKHDD